MKALLREFYGSGVTKVKIETKPWKIELPTRKLEIELMTLSSNYHVEMNPSDVGNNDRCAKLSSDACKQYYVLLFAAQSSPVADAVLCYLSSTEFHK